MRRRQFITLTTGALLATALPAAAETRVVYSPGDGYLNLRTGPGSSFAILREMDHGSLVEVLEVSGNWLRVRHESGAVGWAYAKYLRRPVSNAYYVYSPGDGYLNLRTGPGTRYDIIRRMYTSFAACITGNWCGWSNALAHGFGSITKAGRAVGARPII